MEAVGGFGSEDVGMDEVEKHFAGQPQLAQELARSWTTELKELIGLAAEDDRPEPLQDYVTRGRSWKFMTVIEHALRRGSADGEGGGGGAGGVFGNEVVDMLIGLYQVRPAATALALHLLWTRVPGCVNPAGRPEAARTMWDSRNSGQSIKLRGLCGQKRSANTKHDSITN